MPRGRFHPSYPSEFKAERSAWSVRVGARSARYGPASDGPPVTISWSGEPHRSRRRGARLNGLVADSGSCHDERMFVG